MIKFLTVKTVEKFRVFPTSGGIGSSTTVTYECFPGRNNVQSCKQDSCMKMSILLQVIFLELALNILVLQVEDTLLQSNELVTLSSQFLLTALCHHVNKGLVFLLFMVNPVRVTIQL